MIYAITVAFCPAAQLARSLMLYKRTRGLMPDRHIVVQGHYPINRKKNNRDIEMICEAAGVELWDPGSDLGSAQSQNWALEKLEAGDGDFFINIDPDSAGSNHWDSLAYIFLDKNVDCALVSCWSDMWEPYRNRLGASSDLDVMKAIHPTPFNLSMFNCGFIKEIGGLRQLGEKWGELEACFYQECQQRGKYHAYLMNCIEDTSSKYMQDKQLLDYKDGYLRSTGEKQFTGTYLEYLKWYHPDLLKTDTLIPEGTEFQ